MTEVSPRKIGVVGCGALGSYYGAKLWRAGHRVHFLLRSDYEQVKAHGVRIESVDGDFLATPVCAKTPEEIGACDVVLIGLKTTANSALSRLLPPLIGPGTAIVSLQNGLGNEDALAALFGPENILHGLCFLCSNRIAPGHIRHSAFGRIVLGEYGRSRSARTEGLAEMIRAAGVPCEVTDDLERANWEKLLWNIPFNGLGVAGAAGYEAMVAGQIDCSRPVGPCLATDGLLEDGRWERLVRALMEEIVAVSQALGRPVAPARIEDNIERTRRMGAYKASTLLDFEHGLPLELDTLFLEPLRRARLTGVATPVLERLCGVLAGLAGRSEAEH